MALNPRISLEQWRALLAVVDAGGYAQAAAVLHKSQSAVTYAVQKMEALLGVKIFEVIGRKAHLTATGQVLYRRAKALLEEAGALETAAGSLAAGWEPELRLAVERVRLREGRWNPGYAVAGGPHGVRRQADERTLERNVAIPGKTAKRIHEGRCRQSRL